MDDGGVRKAPRLREVTARHSSSSPNHQTQSRPEQTRSQFEHLSLEPNEDGHSNHTRSSTEGRRPLTHQRRKQADPDTIDEISHSSNQDNQDVEISSEPPESDAPLTPSREPTRPPSRIDRSSETPVRLSNEPSTRRSRQSKSTTDSSPIRVSTQTNTSVEDDGAARPKGRSQRKQGEIVDTERFPRIELLGKGASGKVYLCREAGSNEIFAMKVYSKDATIRLKRVENVMCERNILASLDHPFVACLRAAYSDECNLYLVMEFCAGGELFTLLKRQGAPLSEEDAKFYAAEILLGLEYLHANGVSYRDLKGENILLSPKGHVRLTDFDLSSLHSKFRPKVSPMKPHPGHNSWSTRVKEPLNQLVGTLEYVAPEVMQQKSHDEMADWWSYGILLHEMLLGHSPFARMTRPQIAAALKKGSLNITRGNISDSAFSLLKQLLTTNPNKRIGSKFGAGEIKLHPWFAGLDFNLLRNRRPPIVPQLDTKFDTANFVTPIETDERDPVPVKTDVFNGYEYNRPDVKRYGEEGTVARPRVSHISRLEEFQLAKGIKLKVSTEGGDPVLTSRLKDVPNKFVAYNHK